MTTQKLTEVLVKIVIVRGVLTNNFTLLYEFITLSFCKILRHESMLATKTIVIVSSAVILDIQITIFYNVRNIEFLSVTFFLDTKSLWLEIKPPVEFLISRVFSPVL
jgi:hypothetical protein